MNGLKKKYCFTLEIPQWQIKIEKDSVDFAELKPIAAILRNVLESIEEEIGLKTTPKLQDSYDGFSAIIVERAYLWALEQKAPFSTHDLQKELNIHDSTAGKIGHYLEAKGKFERLKLRGQHGLMFWRVILPPEPKNHVTKAAVPGNDIVTETLEQAALRKDLAERGIQENRARVENSK